MGNYNNEYGLYTHRIYNITNGLINFHGCRPKVYQKNNQYFIEWTYKDLAFVVNLDYNRSFEDIYLDAIHNGKVIKSFVYDSENYIFNLMALLSINDIEEKYFENEKPRIREKPRSEEIWGI